MRRALVALAVSVVLTGVAMAGPYEDGEAAYNGGDYAAALRLWRPLAEQGNAIAQHDLGVMYDFGLGVAQDQEEAARWYLLAAAQGVARAQNQLGSMYHYGAGVPQNHAEAVRWFRLAAEQNNAGAQNNLGLMFREGHGVPQDYAEAMRWFHLAAEQGDDLGMTNLASMYEQGIGTPQDFVQAHMWFNLAVARARPEPSFPQISGTIEAEARDRVASDRAAIQRLARMLLSSLIADRDRVAARMTPTQIAEAQRLAREWDAAHPVAR